MYLTKFPEKPKRELENPVWGPQSWEGVDQFNAFVLYRDTPIDKKRSVADVARQIGKDPSGTQLQSRQNRWEERALAYDRHLDSYRLRQVKRRTVEMYERQSAISVAMQQIVAERLKTIDAEKLTARDIREWMDVATRIELRSRGESTENINFNVTDGREQQVERAKEFYKEMTLESPTMPEKEKAAIILEAFDVKPHELGLAPDLLDIQDVGETAS